MRDLLHRLSKFCAEHEVWARRFVLGVGILILLACAFLALTRPMNGDFKLHWEFGRRFLAGEFLYAGGMHLPYPPFWAMAHAPAALLPLPVAKAILFAVGIGALLLLLRILRTLVGAAFPMNPTRAFWVATLALVLAGRYVIRDLAELGVNTALVTLSWLAIYLWRKRRDFLGGTTLGLAVALKCTPAIFVGYFLWKRQWKMFTSSCVAAALFTLAPILWQGPLVYRQHMETWVTNAWQGFGNANPTQGVLGPEPLQNMALRPSLARYLIRLPAGHPGRAANPLYLDALDLSPAAASWTIKVILVALLAGFLWWSRHAVARREDPRLLWEFAALSILMLLFSPITWGQHCVALLPACYLIAALCVTRVRLPRWMLALLALYLLFVPILSRDLIGRDFAVLLASYHVETFAIVGLLAVVIGSRRLVSATTR